MPFSFDYLAPVELSPDNRSALIRVIDTMENRNNWRVTSEALDRALKTLIGKPLIAYPDHAGSVEVGLFTEAYKPDGYAVGKARIKDKEAFKKIKSGEWRFVSPKVIAYDVTKEDGVDVLKEFAFEHVAFVPEGAYPHAQVLSTFAGQESGLRSFSAALTEKLEEHKVTQAMAFTARVIPFNATPKAPEDTAWNYREADYEVDQLRRACAWYDSENPDVKASYKLPHHLPDGRVVWRGVAAAMAALLGARGGVDIPSADRRGVFAHLVGHYRQFDKEPPEFEGQIKEPKGEKWKMDENIHALEMKLAEANKKIASLDEANKELGERVEQFEAERHSRKVNELMSLRAEAGFNATEEDLKRFDDTSDEVLDQLITDTKTFIANMPVSTGPKAKYTAEQYFDATEKARLRLFGYTRDKDGKIVGGV